MKKNIFSIRSIACGLLVSILMPVALEAYPYLYRRLVLEKDGKIVKIVDLISDIHLPEVGSMSEQKGRLGPSERKLIQVLRKIGNRENGETIELFGESCPEGRALISTSDAEACPLGLIRVTSEFHRKFHTRKAKRLIYRDADTYRKSGTNSKFIFDLVKPNSLIEQDLVILKKRIDSQTYAKIDALWKTFKTQLCIPFCKAAKEVVAGKSSKKKAHASVQNLNGLYSKLILQTMDLEVLIEIFKSKQKHVMVYAGGHHCLDVSDWLEKQFNFIVVESVGTEYSSEMLVDLVATGDVPMPANPDKNTVLNIARNCAPAPLPDYVWDHLLDGITNTVRHAGPHDNNAPAAHAEVPGAHNNNLDADAALARQLQEEMYELPAAASVAVAGEMDEATRALVQLMLEEDGN